MSGLIQVTKYCSMLVMKIPFPDDLGFDPAIQLNTPFDGSVLRLLLPLGLDGAPPLGSMIIDGSPPGGGPGLGGGGAPGGQPGGGGGAIRGSPPL